MKFLALVSAHILWLIGILYITLAHGDLFRYGKTESFSLYMNVSFIALSGLLVFALRKEIKKHKIRYLIGVTAWAVLAVFLGLPSQLLAFGGKPSEQTIEELAVKKGITDDNIVKMLGGPSLSATTQYQRDVYRWNSYFDLLFTRNPKTDPVAGGNG